MDKRIIAGGTAVVLAAGLGYWLTRPAKSDRSADKAGGGSGVVAGAAGSRGGAAPVEPGRLSGTVSNRAGGAGLAGAVVQLSLETGDGDPRAVRTDASGGFAIDEVAPGSYVVSAAAPGFLPTAGTRVELAPGGDESVKLELEAGGNKITGVVSDVSGGPVADAVVRFVPVHGVLSAAPAEGFGALTGADGRFELGAPDGLYQATAAHTDYVPETRRLEIAGGEREVSFALTPGGIIEGIVLGADGKPVPHALVAYSEQRVMQMPGVGSMMEGGRRGGATAAADGRFRLTGLMSGAVSLTARGGGGVTADETLVGMAIGETVTGVELYLEGARAIRGLVVDRKSGAPVEGVRVEADGDGESVAASAPTGADGRFEILDVASGGYRLVTEGGGYLTSGFGKAVSVGDADLEDVRIEVDRGYTVRGRVDPATRAEVGLRMADERGMNRGVLTMGARQTGADGAFEIGPLRAGEHTLEATAEDGRTGAAAITIVDDDLADVVIALEPGASIAGRVVDASGKPVTDANVVLKKRGGTRRVTMIVNGRDVSARQSPTHAGGEFLIRGIEAGDYALSVVDDDLQPLAWSDGKTGGKPITLAEGEERTGVTLKVEQKDGTIRGVALGPDGKPAADVWVTASAAMSFGDGPPEGGGDHDGPTEVSESRMVVASGGGGGGFGGIRPALTDADGRFELRDLRRGRYELMGRGLSGGARGYAHGVETGSEVTLKLSALATIKGTVTQGGAPITQFHVELAGQESRSRSVRDRGGAFTLTLVDPGKHSLRVRSAEGSAELEIDVKPGVDNQVEVALESLVPVRGTVVDESGAPVVGAMVVTSPDKGDGRVMIAISSSEAPPTTDKDGRFEIRVKPGKHMVVVMAEDSPGPVVVKPFEVGEEPIDLGTLTKGERPSRGGPGAGDPPTDDEDVDIAPRTTSPRGAPAAAAPAGPRTARAP